VRFDLKEGLLELHNMFQLVLFSTYSEKLTFSIINILQSKIPGFKFDAVYCSLNRQSPEEPVCYNQIYFDFEVVALADRPLQQIPVSLDGHLSLEFTDRIEKEVLVISAISHQEMVQKDSKDFYELRYDYTGEGETSLLHNHSMNVFGLPVRSQQFTPLMLTVPNVQSQHDNKSISFKQISELADRLRISSYLPNDEATAEYNQQYYKERIAQNEILF